MLAAVLVFDDRVDQPFIVTALEMPLEVVPVEAMGRLLDRPAVIAAGHHQIDLLVGVLADIAHEKTPGAIRVKGDLVGVAKTHGVDLAAIALLACKGVVFGNAVGGAIHLIDVDPEDLAQQVAGVLACAFARIIAVFRRTAAIAKCDMQHALGPESECAGIMGELRLIDLQYQPLVVRIGPVRIVCRHPDFGDMAGVRPPFLVLKVVSCAKRRAVVDIKLATARIGGMESEAESAALVEARFDRRIEPVPKIEKRFIQELAVSIDDA